MTADIKPVTLWRPPLRKDGQAIESLREQREFQAALIKELLPYQDEAVASRTEIETLRAEVKSLQTLRDVVIENHGYWKDRAERLEEALHKLEDSCEDSDGAQYGTLATSFVRGICKDALRGHDQEAGK